MLGLPGTAFTYCSRLPLRSFVLDQFNRRSNLRNQFRQARIFAITLAALSLFAAVEARGQVTIQPQYQGTVTGTFFGPGGSIAVGTFNSTETPPCGDEPPIKYNPGGFTDTREWEQWQECIDERSAEQGLGLLLIFASHQGSPVGPVLQPAPLAGPAFNPTLASGAATLPFLGNQLVGISYEPDAATAETAAAAYSVTLRRKADCSLDEDLVLPNSTATPNGNFFTTLTGAQDFYHQLAGLTTTPDVFANGCGYQDLGLPATSTITLLGTTSSGATISAELANAGLYVTVTDPAANTFKHTQVTVSPNQSAGYYSSASLRNNGIMDLVETDITDPVTKVQSTAVVLGNGDGTFKTPVYYDVADTGGGPGGFTIDDVNGDGIPDIVVLQTASVVNTGYPVFTGTVTTLIGKGDGTFTIGPVSNVSWTSSNLALTGDFNGDGKRDLLVGGTVLFGNSDGTFTVGPTNTAIAAANTTAVFGNAAGILRNNGKFDVVVSVPGYVSIFYGNGDGTFQTGPKYAGLPDFMNVTIADIDGDGNPDIFLGNSTAGVYAQGVYDVYPPVFQILMGRGDGTFVDSLAYPVGTYSRDKQIAVADFNGDSKADVLVFNSSNNGSTASTLAMLPGDGKGNLGAAVTSTVNNFPAILVATKMFHDTSPDAVVAGYGFNNAGPEVSILTNQGNGTFAAEKDYSLAANPVSLAVGDFNGDGLPDVAVGESGMGVFVLLRPVQWHTRLSGPGGPLDQPHRPCRRKPHYGWPRRPYRRRSGDRNPPRLPRQRQQHIHLHDRSCHRRYKSACRRAWRP